MAIRPVKPARPQAPTPEADARETAPRGLVHYDEPSQIAVKPRNGVSDGRVMADLVLSPVIRHSALATEAGSRGFGGKPPAMDAYESFSTQIEAAASGDVAAVSRTLASQAISLDALFTELAQRSRDCMASRLDAAERFMRLALKAQSNSRATIEALAKLHQPREQTVRHIHVNEGGQAVIADQFHHHTGGQANGQRGAQPHATRAGSAGTGPALPSQDALGNPVPVSSRSRKRKVQDARRQG